MTAQDDRMLQARLAEYASHRAEIGWRTNAQQTLLGLNVTAAGLVGSAALSAPSRRLLLLVLPYVCSALGMAWLDHGRSIAKTAQHIRVALWPGVQEDAGLTTPEERHRLRCRDDYLIEQDVETRARYRLTVVVPYGLVFTAPSIAALAFAWPANRSVGLAVLWAAGLVLTIANLAWWARFSPISR
jgi:hypothetical protein